jgi:hypothetical protein
LLVSALLLAAALAVRILLLLLSGLLATALLLTRLLARVLVLLARILVLVGHSGSPLLDVTADNGEVLIWLRLNRVPRKAIARKYRVTTKAPEPKLTLQVTPCCCRTGFPLLEKRKGRVVRAAKAIAAEFVE